MPTERTSPAGARESAEDRDDASEWLERHGDALYRYARARVGRRDVAEDLVQETFLAGLRARDQFGHRSSVRTWLVAILRRKIMDHYRRSRAARIEIDPTTAPQPSSRLDPILSRFFKPDGHWLSVPSPWKGPEEVAEAEEFREILDGCLGGLPPSMAEVFVLRELEECEPPEICETLGLSAGNLRIRLHRARLLLRQCLEDHGFGRARKPDRDDPRARSK